MVTRASLKRVETLVEKPSCSTSKKYRLKTAKNQMSIILELNDDCLVLIYKKLLLKDQIVFACTCLRLKSIFQSYCKPCKDETVFALCQIENLSPAAKVMYLEVLGPFIWHWDRVQDNEEHRQALTLVSRCCPNLKTVTWWYGDIDSSEMINFLEEKRSITEVKFHSCGRIKSGIIFALQKLPELETLRVYKEFPVQLIPTLKRLKQLTLAECEMTEKKWIKIFQKLPELRTLNLTDCYKLSDSILKEIVHNLKKLEVLKMSLSCKRCVTYESVTLLPNLKRLELSWSNSADASSMFAALAEHKADQLEYLKISFNTLDYKETLLISRIKTLKCLNLQHCEVCSECFPVLCNLKNLEVVFFKYCIELTNEAMLEILRKCTKIKILSLWNCNEITTEFVEAAIEVLRKRDNPPAQPVLFYLKVKLISESIFDHPEVLKAKSLIKISLRPYDDNDDHDNYERVIDADRMQYEQQYEYLYHDEPIKDKYPFFNRIGPIYLKKF